MPDIRLSEEQERARAALFPDMSPTDYAAMIKRKRAEFNTLPQSEQNRIEKKTGRNGSLFGRIKGKSTRNECLILGPSCGSKSQAKIAGR